MTDINIRLQGQNNASQAVQAVTRDVQKLQGAARGVDLSGGASTGLATQARHVRSLGESVERFAGPLLAGAFLLAGRAAVQFGAQSIGAFSGLNESLNKSVVVFDKANATISAFAADSVRGLGMSRQAATEAASTYGNLFTSMGIGQQPAADMSVGLVKLASDLASFNNIDPGLALEKLRAGMVGEVEPLRTLGINLDAASVKARAMKMGLADASGEVSYAALLQARYALILEQSTNAQGDFTRTADGLANALRIQGGAVVDLQVALGSLVAKPYLVVVKSVTKSAEEITASIEKGEYKNGADPVLKWLLRNTPAALAANTELAQATRERQAAEQELERALQDTSGTLGMTVASAIELAEAALFMAQQTEGAALRTKLLRDGLNEIARAAGSAAAGVGDYVSRLQDIGSVTPPVWKTLPLDPMMAYKNAPSAYGMYGERFDEAPSSADFAKVIDRQEEAIGIRERADKDAAAAWKSAAADVAAAWKDAISGVPGLLGTSKVTAEDMALAKGGGYQDKADEYLRRLRDEVKQGKDLYPNVSIQDAASRIGMTGQKDEAVLARFEQMWENSSLFANPKNLDLINWNAVKTGVAEDAAGKQGKLNILGKLGIEDEALRDSLNASSALLSKLGGVGTATAPGKDTAGQQAPAASMLKDTIANLDNELLAQAEVVKGQGGKFWTTFEGGIIDKAKSSNALWTAVEAMVMSILANAITKK